MMFRNWPMYRLMESPPPEGPAGGGVTPPVVPPAEPPAGDPPVDPVAQMISLDVLPDDLKNRPEAEVKFLLDHMVASLGQRNQQVEDLRTQLANQNVGPPAPPPPPDPHADKPMEELILENPEAAMDRYMASRGYVKEFGNLADRVGEAEFTMVAAETPDFAEYEADVKQLLKDGRIPSTRSNIMGAYKLAVGNRVVTERMLAARAGVGSIPPSGPPPPAAPDPNSTMSDLEKEIMAGHGITDEAEWTKYRDGELAIKLPT